MSKLILEDYIPGDKEQTKQVNRKESQVSETDQMRKSIGRRLLDKLTGKNKD